MYGLYLFKMHATREDWDSMIETLPENLARSFLYTTNGGYCTLGWMGHCAGIHDNWMKTSNIKYTLMHKTRIYNDIAHYWRLTTEDLLRIYKTNDTIPMNRDEILELLNELKERYSA